VEAIGHVRHKNLVRLLGYCIEGVHRYEAFTPVNLIILSSTHISHVTVTGCMKLYLWCVLHNSSPILLC